MSIANIFSIIKAMIGMLPIIEQVIVAVEAMFPAGGSGVQKLELAKAMIQSAYETANEFEAPFASVWPSISAVIANLVPVFAKSAAAVDPATADHAAVIANAVRPVPGSQVAPSSSAPSAPTPPTAAAGIFRNDA